MDLCNVCDDLPIVARIKQPLEDSVQETTDVRISGSTSA